VSLGTGSNATAFLVDKQSYLNPCNLVNPTNDKLQECSAKDKVKAMTNAPVDNWIGCWNVIKKQYEEFEYVAVDTCCAWARGTFFQLCCCVSFLFVVGNSFWCYLICTIWCYESKTSSHFSTRKILLGFFNREKVR
jgi:hypothetical protein